MNRRFSLSLVTLLCVLFFSCNNRSGGSVYDTPDFAAEAKQQYSEAAADIFSEVSVRARSILDSLTLEQRVSQLMLVGVDNKSELSPWNRNFLQDTMPGGVLLFGYNIADTIEETAAFVSSVSEAVETGCGIPPFITIDHEGGDVNRLRFLNIKLPAAADVPLICTPDEAVRLYAASGEQLSSIGITLNLAPVVEVLNDSNSAVLAGRAFSGSASVVCEYAGSFINGMGSAGILSAVKHFPGNADDDPHLSLPVLDIAYDVFKRDYLLPFTNVFRYKPAAVMMSHLVVSCVDPGVPSCLSRKMVTGILREGLGFRGLILSDDIRMAALGENGFSPEKAALMAIDAGVTMIMISGGDLWSIHDAIVSAARDDPLLAAKIDTAAEMVLAAKIQNGLLRREIPL
ncbi:MAG: glycoside hydrolase family 3 protein [Spirochaetaceae bacterium]|jgi:beta-N-acetylhexosaminidase|nr:glycoside hydrolase family 3 protein [Spirochaetaceae bacterium]